MARSASINELRVRHPGPTPDPGGNPSAAHQPYGASKLMVERMLPDFGHAHGLRSIALGYFNASGADPDGEIGEDHDPETHLISLVLDAASGRRPNMRIFGTDYDTPDGSCIRYYLYVHDLADPHVRAVERLDGGPACPAYNLGTGSGVSVRQLIDTARRITERPIEVVNGPRRAGDPPELVSDARTAGRDLGWQPANSAIETIIRTAWSWHLEHQIKDVAAAPSRPGQRAG